MSLSKHLCNTDPLHEQDGHLTNRDRDKAEVLMTFFASVFNMDDGSRKSQYPDHDCKNDQIPVDPKIVHKLLLQLDPYKSLGPDGIHPRTLKEMANINTKLLLMIFKPPWESRDIPADWKLVNIVLIFKSKRKTPETTNLSVSLHCLVKPWKRGFWEVLRST
ncbi:hypothetical protein TURU_151347 [Turdus rufiventris]|nr:hypothetical protein TURU_151347 [Turdus rufiventris]